MLKIVVFPAPFGPIRPTSSCGSMARLKSVTAVRPPKRIVTPRASSSGIVAPFLRRRVLALRQHLPQLAAAEESLRPREHQHDQRDRVDDHARVLVGVDHFLGHAQQLGEDRQHDGGDDRAGDRAEPAEDHHHHELERPQERERCRVQVHLVVREEPARDAGPERADDERLHLVLRSVHAHRLGGDLVLAHGQERAADRGAHEAPRDHDRQAGEEVDPEEIAPVRDAAEAVRAADLLDVEDEHADDLAEAERDDGQVIAAQPQRRQADEVAGHRRQRAAREQRHNEERVLRAGILVGVRREVEVGEERGEVSAHGHESGVAERELPGVAVDDVQRHRQRDVDADQDDDAGVVGDAGEAQRGQAPGGGEEESHEDREVDGVADEPGTAFHGAALANAECRMQNAESRGWRERFCILHSAFCIQTFSASYLPKSPLGRNSRMTMRITKAMASRKFENWLPPTKASTMPMVSPPTTAPGTLPMPPRTAAMKALSPGMIPISGSIFGYERPKRMPATAASAEPMTNVVEMTRSTGMPISDAVSKLYDTARMARPNFVP